MRNEKGVGPAEELDEAKGINNNRAVFGRVNGFEEIDGGKNILFFMYASYDSEFRELMTMMK